ncbi:MAG TPA: sigma-70 family RNA polymerase sigma factor [Thermoleophilaceae bacterium]
MQPDVVLRSRLDDNQLVKRHRAGDRAALDELIARYAPLASGLARRYSYTSESTDDLEQVAAVGLVAAIKRYDPDRGKSLRAFAVPTILGELRRHFRDTGWSVHMPRPLQERARDVREVTTRMGAELQRSPTPREVAQRMNLSVENVLESRAVRRAYSPDSLDAPPAPDKDGSPRTWDAFHGCEEEGYARVEAHAVVDRAMRALPEREQQIIRLRFGAELSQAEIGTVLGISQMHVSRLLRRSLDRVGTIASA